MAEADCPTCYAMGYRSCDRCGGPAWTPDNLRVIDGEELCAYCFTPPDEAAATRADFLARRRAERAENRKRRAAQRLG